MHWPSIRKYIAVICYLALMAIASFEIKQSHFNSLLFFLLTGFTWCIYFSKNQLTFRQLLGVGIVVRLFFILHSPSLSDDFYRFLWDGLVCLDGYNPYQYTPSQLMELIGNNPKYLDIYTALNSPEYYSVYPPLSQAVFTISAWLSGPYPFVFQLILGSIFVFTDALLLFCLKFLLGTLQLSPSWLPLYFLNPFVVIEFCGNLHFDLFLGLGIVLGLVFLFKKKYLLSTAVMIGATGIKPQFILIVPFLLLLSPTKKNKVHMGMIYIIGCAFLYFPLILSSGQLGFDDSLDLYFRKFEFNGSLYLLFRWIGFKITGFNAIGVVGPLMAAVATVLIFSLFYRAWTIRNAAENNRSLLILAAGTFTIYLLFATTVHPWYLLPLLLIGIFIEAKWILLWSFTIMWSYAFYDPEYHNYHEIIGLSGYALPLVFYILEWHKKRETSS
ncbi:MAG TPA: hypothetical protein VJ917_09275 [Saprospiraceae bacterium]|nr:hypothetical protein [Saprospiraceae bacterium]